MKLPIWIRRARRSWIAAPYMFIACAVTLNAAHGQPLWARTSYAMAAFVLYFIAWKLADVLACRHSRRA